MSCIKPSKLLKKYVCWVHPSLLSVFQNAYVCEGVYVCVRECVCVCCVLYVCVWLYYIC